MSSSDTEASELSFSPPTSPVRDVSPLASPCRDSTQESPISSSPTSPLKRKRRLKGKVYRTTVKRRNECADAGNERGSGTESEEDGVQEVSCPANEMLLGDDDPQASDCDNSTDSSGDSGDSSSSSSIQESLNSEASRSGGDTEAEVNSDDSCISDSDAGTHPLCAGSALTLNESLLSVLKLHMNQKWTKTSLDMCVKVFKKLLPKPNDFPSSGKSLLKNLERLTGTYQEEVHYYCDQCNNLLPGEIDKCGECNNDVAGRFYSFPFGDQIKHLFENRNLAEIIDLHREHDNRREGYICDIKDGSEYQRVKEHLPGLYDLILLWSTDEVALSGSSNQELWPVPAVICEVPVRLRPSYMLVCGVHVGPKKPNMNLFLKPFVRTLQELYTNGVTWNHPLSKQQYTSRVTAPVLSADAPAKAEVLNHGYHNSKYGCNTCEQKSKRVDLTPEEIIENEAQVNPRKRRKRRFVFEDDTRPAILRTGEHMHLQGTLADVSGKPQKGVMGKTVVSDIPLLDQAHCVSAEYLHLVALGVVRYFLSKIFFDKGGDWYLGNKTSDIDEFISNIKVPDFVKRLPRGIKNFKYWKGSEFRNFLLYYSLPLFRIFLADKYYQHWMLLVGAMYILLQEQISENDLKRSEIMLRCFVRDIGKLYGDVCYTYNVHTLLHLSLLVRRWGNLFNTSGFTFESFNGFLSSHLHGTKHLDKELVENLKIFHSVAILENLVDGGPPEFPRTLIPASTQLLGRAWKKSVLSVEERSAIDVVLLRQNYVVYHSIKVASSLYTSSHYDHGKRRSNSYVKFTAPNDEPQSSGYGRIAAFIKSDDDSVFCCIQDFKVINVHLFVHEDSRYVFQNLVPFQVTDRFIVAPVNNLISALLKVSMYLVSRPNSYEINL